jgi:hypothetical protein
MHPLFVHQIATARIDEARRKARRASKRRPRRLR